MNAYSGRLALVGDRSPHVRSHARLPGLLRELEQRDHLDLDIYWIPTDAVGDAIAGFDGIWLLPGSPYRSEAGALAAVRTAREQGIPFLGTCGGFQHAMLEYARSVGGATGVQHGETNPEADDLLIVPLQCSLDGHEGVVHTTPGTRAAELLGGERSMERYHCSYGLDSSRLDLLRDHGMVFSGHDDAGEPRIAELPGHPFYLATLFQPELAAAGNSGRPHPFVQAFAHAVAGRNDQIVEDGRGSMPASV